MTIETAIKKEIVAYLDSLGPSCWHVAYMSHGYGRRGVPDRIGVYRGRLFAIEVKKSSLQKPTKWQWKELIAIDAAGGISIVAWSVDQVQRMIREIDQDVHRVF